MWSREGLLLFWRLRPGQNYYLRWPARNESRVSLAALDIVLHNSGLPMLYNSAMARQFFCISLTYLSMYAITMSFG